VSFLRAGNETYLRNSTTEAQRTQRIISFLEIGRCRFPENLSAPVAHFSSQTSEAVRRFFIGGISRQ
jgi:hypothetical protein